MNAMLVGVISSIRGVRSFYVGVLSPVVPPPKIPELEIAPTRLYRGSARLSTKQSGVVVVQLAIAVAITAHPQVFQMPLPNTLIPPNHGFQAFLDGLHCCCLSWRQRRRITLQKARHHIVYPQVFQMPLPNTLI